MEQIKDTVLEHGVIFWPIRPPKTSMLVVVKATFSLSEARAVLADVQDPAMGELYWDDDPERSVRYPSDFALLKPRGECFVVGSCRTLSERPVEQTVASFRVGSVQKSLSIYGDRTWVGNSPSRPVPFTEMPLCWERSFGGPGHAQNPVGRGIADDAGGVAWLPNIEDAARTIASRRDRPQPAGAFPLGMTWPARARHVGTYDAKWQKTRAPWLAEDFRFEFFNEAPDEQQVQGFWRGDEKIELRNLHPEHTSVRASLPGVLARAFVERGASFDEVPLALDTLTIDADRGLAFAVWRGTVELDHDRLVPDGVDRLFVMHEDAASPSTVAECRERMRAKIAALAAEAASMQGEPPPLDTIPAPMDETIADAEADLAGVRAAAEALRNAEAPKEDKGAEALEKLKHDLTNAGVDVEKMMAEAEGEELAQPEPADTSAILKALEESETEVPAELVEELLNPQPEEEEPDFVPPPPKPPTDLRALVVDLHRRGVAVRGDFSGANLAGLDLLNIDARDAIFMDANFRGANLAGAKLDGASFLRADFLSACLSRSSVKNADFTDAVLEDVKFDGARLDGATFERAEMQHAVLDGAQLAKADLTGANLSEASFIGARCDAAVFNGAVLESANCKRASLVSARFYSVQAPKINLDNAELRGLRVGRGADLSGASVRGAKAEESGWRDSKLEGVSFRGSTLAGADFSRSEMAGARLGGCMMRRARFLGCRLKGAVLAGSDMYEAMFREAELQDVSFKDASLYRADFYKAFGENVDLDGANLDGTTWDGR